MNPFAYFEVIISYHLINCFLPIWALSEMQSMFAPWDSAEVER